MGGEEKPCMPRHFLAAEEAKGYPCPRREWPDRDAPILADLVRLGARGESGHLWTRLFEVTYGDASREEQRRMLTRILRAYGDEVVGAALWPKLD